MSDYILNKDIDLDKIENEIKEKLKKKNKGEKLLELYIEVYKHYKFNLGQMPKDIYNYFKEVPIEKEKAFVVIKEAGLYNSVYCNSQVIRLANYIIDHKEYSNKAWLEALKLGIDNEISFDIVKKAATDANTPIEFKNYIDGCIKSKYSQKETVGNEEYQEKISKLNEEKITLKLKHDFVVEQRDSYKNDLNELRKEKRSLLQELSEFKSSNEKLTKKVKELDDELDHVKKECEEKIKEVLEEQKNNLEAAENEDELKEDIHVVEEDIQEVEEKETVSEEDIQEVEEIEDGPEEDIREVEEYSYNKSEEAVESITYESSIGKEFNNEEIDYVIHGKDGFLQLVEKNKEKKSTNKYNVFGKIVSEYAYKKFLKKNVEEQKAYIFKMLTRDTECRNEKIHIVKEMMDKGYELSLIYNLLYEKYSVEDMEQLLNHSAEEINEINNLDSIEEAFEASYDQVKEDLFYED